MPPSVHEPHPLANTYDKKGHPIAPVTVEQFENGKLRLEVTRLAPEYEGGPPEKCDIPVPLDQASRATKQLCESIGGGGKYEWRIIPEVGGKIIDQGTWVASGPPVPRERIGTITGALYAAEKAGGAKNGSGVTTVSLGSAGVLAIAAGTPPEQVQAKIDEATRLAREEREAQKRAEVAKAEANARAAESTGVLGAVMPAFTALAAGRSGDDKALEEARTHIASLRQQLIDAHGDTRRLTNELADSTRREQAAMTAAANTHGQAIIALINQHTDTLRGERQTHDRAMDDLRRVMHNTEDALRKDVRDAQAEVLAVKREAAQEIATARGAEMEARRDVQRRIDEAVLEARKPLLAENERLAKALAAADDETRAANREIVRLERESKHGHLAVELMNAINANPMLKRFADSLGDDKDGNATAILEQFAEFIPAIKAHPFAYGRLLHALRGHVPALVESGRLDKFIDVVVPAVLAVPENFDSLYGGLTDLPARGGSSAPDDAS